MLDVLRGERAVIGERWGGQQHERDERKQGGAHVSWFCSPRTSANHAQLLAVTSRRHAERLPQATFLGLSDRDSASRWAAVRAVPAVGVVWVAVRSARA